MATMTFSKSNPFLMPRKKPLEAESSILKVRRYFQQILCTQRKDNFIKFPSLSALSGFLQLPVRDIRTALEELKYMGYDYEIVHAKDAIIVWDRFLLSAMRA